MKGKYRDCNIAPPTAGVRHGHDLKFSWRELKAPDWLIYCVKLHLKGALDDISLVTRMSNRGWSLGSQEALQSGSSHRVQATQPRFLSPSSGHPAKVPLTEFRPPSQGSSHRVQATQPRFLSPSSGHPAKVPLTEFTRPSQGVLGVFLLICDPV